jgi:hypothetical protein
MYSEEIHGTGDEVPPLVSDAGSEVTILFRCRTDHQSRFAIVVLSTRGGLLTFVTDERSLLQISLRSYGEEELALRVFQLSDAEMRRIGEVAKQHFAALGGPLNARGPSDRLTRTYSKAESLAAIEVMEGTRRPLKRKRRNLKGIFGRNN